jgi:hypothetical protein
MSVADEIFNAGEEVIPLVQPDNKTSFLLTEDEVAFVNVINMQSAMLKTVLFTLVKQVEDQMEQQMRVLSALRDQFITAVANKHSIKAPASNEGSLEIDLANKLITLVTSKVP